MTVNTQKLAKNTGILMVSQVISWALGIMIAFIIPRYLGPENFGKINIAGSLWVIVGIVAIFGMDTLLTKTIARSPEELSLLFSQTIYVRLSLFLIATIGLMIYISLMGYTRDFIFLILIAGIHMFTGLFNGVFFSSIQGLERVDLLAYIDIISKTLSAVIIGISVMLGAGVYVIQFVLGIGTTINFFLLSIAFFRLYPFKINFRIQPEKMKWLLTAGSAFFLLYIFITIYQQIDIVVLSWLVDEDGVGVYSAADKLIGTLMFIPTTFMLVFFPTFSRLHLEGPETLKKIFVKAINLIILLGISIGFGAFAISDQVIAILYGADYGKSVAILSIRSITLVFTFLNIIMGMYLMSIDKQKAWVLVVAIASFATIPLDLIFVPLSLSIFENGAMGGAIATVVTEFGMVIAAFLFVPAGILGRQTFWYALRTILAGAGMVLCIFAIGMGLLPLQIGVGIVSFSVFAILFRLISSEDMEMIQKGFNRYFSRFRREAANPAK